MLKNKSIMITGGTGSFGHAFVPMTLAKFNPSRLVIFSRDEMKQWEMAKLYGEDPVFIYDPDDHRNRPDPEVHKAAVITWPIYPRRLQQLFEKTFGVGMKNPSARVLTGQWCEALASCLDQRLICPHCGQEAFASQGQSIHCWACEKEIEPPMLLKAGHGAVFAQPDNEL